MLIVHDRPIGCVQLEYGIVEPQDQGLDTEKAGKNEK